EEVVDVSQAKPELAHEDAAVFVVVLADVCQRGVGGLPQPLGEGKGLKAVGWRVAQPGLQRATVFACPDLMQVGLDDSIEVPAVSGEDVKGFSENPTCWRSRKVEVLGMPYLNEAAAQGADGGVKLVSGSQEPPPISLAPHVLLLHPFGLHLFLDYRERFGILSGSFFRPIVKADNTTLRILDRSVV